MLRKDEAEATKSEQKIESPASSISNSAEEVKNEINLEKKPLAKPSWEGLVRVPDFLLSPFPYEAKPPEEGLEQIFKDLRRGKGERKTYFNGEKIDRTLLPKERPPLQVIKAVLNNSVPVRYLENKEIKKQIQQVRDIYEVLETKLGDVGARLTLHTFDQSETDPHIKMLEHWITQRNRIFLNTHQAIREFKFAKNVFTVDVVSNRLLVRKSEELECGRNLVDDDEVTIATRLIIKPKFKSNGELEIRPENIRREFYTSNNNPIVMQHLLVDYIEQLCAKPPSIEKEKNKSVLSYFFSSLKSEEAKPKKSQEEKPDFASECKKLIKEIEINPALTHLFLELSKNIDIQQIIVDIIHTRVKLVNIVDNSQKPAVKLGSDIDSVVSDLQKKLDILIDNIQSQPVDCEEDLLGDSVSLRAQVVAISNYIGLLKLYDRQFSSLSSEQRDSFDFVSVVKNRLIALNKKCNEKITQYNVSFEIIVDPSPRRP